MRCEEVRETLPLFLYGELSFDEEERVELHIDECVACREALEREKVLFRSLDAAEAIPDQDLLIECRAELRQSLAQAQPQRASIWDKIREGFTIHFHFAPGMAQPVGAVAMLVLGFAAARMMPGSSRPSAGGVSSTPSITANTFAFSVSSSSPVSSVIRT